jgi:hypothetical protein
VSKEFEERLEAAAGRLTAKRQREEGEDEHRRLRNAVLESAAIQDWIDRVEPLLARSIVQANESLQAERFFLNSTPEISVPVAAPDVRFPAVVITASYKGPPKRGITDQTTEEGSLKLRIGLSVNSDVTVTTFHYNPKKREFQNINIKNFGEYEIEAAIGDFVDALAARAS